MSCCNGAPHNVPVLSLKQVEYPAYSAEDAQAYIDKFAADGEDLALRCYTSNLIGSKASLVLHGGGNTSVKTTVVNKLGEQVPVLCVKGSGYNLDSIIPKGFPQVNLDHLNKMLKLSSLSDPEMVNEFRTNMMDAKSPTPSVETLLHTLIPHKFVDHSHADAIVALADHNLEAANKIFAKAFDGQLKFAVVPYVMPGFGLAGAAKKVFDENPDIECLVLLKHGLFTWGKTAQESYDKHIKAVNLAEKYIEGCSHASLTPRELVAPEVAFRNRVMATIRGIYSELSNGKSWIASNSPSVTCAAFAQSEECATWSQVGTITPDHVIRTKGKPMVLRGLVQSDFYSAEEDIENTETPAGDKKLRDFILGNLSKYGEAYHKYFTENNERVGGIKQELDRLPRVLLVEHFGLITVGGSFKECSISADIYEHTVPTIISSMAGGDGVYEPVSPADLFDCEYWSLEQAKLKLGNSGVKELAGKVAYITGGASGIGLGTALKMASAGAAICIADVHEQRIEDAKVLLKKAGASGILGMIVDVSNLDKVKESFNKVAQTFGGVDIVVSNAGIVVQAAPGMASCPEKDLQLSMNVNFYGHQYISSVAARLMVTQGTGGALLYNVSKAPLNPGPKLGPYCIAKAATLALMRQYAVEYATHGIRANAVNADRVRTNLFDIALVEKRAAARGLTAEQYFKSNLLTVEVGVEDVAKAFMNLALAMKTTGGIYTVDGGNIAAAPR